LTRSLILLLIASPAMLMAGESASLPPERKKLPAIGLLPDGSKLKGVVLPRYDEKRNLVGVLKADTMTLVNEEQISGDLVTVEFFNPDQTPRGRVDLKSAIFKQARGILEAREPVDISMGRLSAHGSGLQYAFENGEGFLLGPAHTIIKPLPETTMTRPSSTLRAAALLGMSLLAQPLHAGPPPKMTVEQKAALDADVASRASTAAAATAEAAKNLQSSLEDANTASRSAKTFLVQAAIPVPTGAAPAPVPAPLDVKPGPNDTVINCEGGMYFNADEGLLVYMKNVRVADPRFDLSGADELKVFFGKKDPRAVEPEAKESDAKAPAGFGKVGANLGDVERIVATGAVKITQKNPAKDKEPIEASGAVFSYNVKSGEIVLSGGYPWVRQGAMYQRAKEPNLMLSIDKNSNIVTEGHWEMGGLLNQKK
jgi:hypothetical protein